MKLTAGDLKELGVIDDVITEPLGGAHRTPEEAIDAVGEAVERSMMELIDVDGETLRRQRREKFLMMDGTQGD